MSNEKTYVEKVNDWLNADPNTRTIEEGAMLMLQGNRNRILHQNVIHKNNVEKVVYELEKIIGSQRVFPEPVPEQIQQLEANIPMTLAGVESILSTAETKGKRADHEALPAAIKAIYDANLEIYPKLRGIHERLKVLNEVGTAEQRLPFLTELLKLDEQLRKNWETYDTFDAANAPIDEKKTPEAPKIDAKRVSSNRKYLSDNKGKLASFIAENKADKAAELLEKMQIRVNELIANGETFAADQLADLKKLGIIIPVSGETKNQPAAEQQEPVKDEVIPPAGTEETKNQPDTEQQSTEETDKENVISQIKTLLKNNIAKEVIIPTILSLGKFGNLDLTAEVVEDLYNKAVDEEIDEEVE